MGWVRANLALQRGHSVNWVPVCLGMGVAGYFAGVAEPSVVHWAMVCGGIVLSVLCAVVWRSMRVVWIGIALILFGFLIAGVRANAVAAPQLGFRYYGPIEGRIVQIDRSQSDAVRLTLDHVVLENLAPARTPARVRVSLHGQQGWIDPVPGLVVILTGHLSPPSGPVEPGGFDFRLSAWFDQLGAVGYTRTPVLALDDDPSGLGIDVLRMRVGDHIRTRLEGDSGAFAAAILTGDRSSIDAEVVEGLRATNLAHLLAISGLHMGLLTGVVFAAIRMGAALFPAVALRLPVKKIAAVAALCVGAFYLLLSGRAVATERAFIMIAVMFVAVLLDRRAVTLRAVAFAATIVIVTRPEEIAGPGFQMSFAATTALVAVFGALRGRGYLLPRALRGVGAVFLSSLVAGLATAPFSAAHFNQFSHYGLIANLMAVPVMGIVVMPAVVLAVVLTPLGFDWIGLWLMEQGIGWILWVSATVAGWPNAVGFVVSPPPIVLPLLALGAIFTVLWQGRWRWFGIVPVVVSLALWSGGERPALLISDTGGLLGVMVDNGRSLSRGTGDSFAAEAWLRGDGDGATQEGAAVRGGFDVVGRTYRTEVAGWEVLLVRGKTALDQLEGCDGADIVVTNQRDQVERPCEEFDLERLQHVGSVAIMPDRDIKTARQVTGERLWNSGGGGRQ
ncbi:competence protein [Aestuarium zhoushanense]|nr:competence protein [Aestuarium zhoushanense]